MPTLSPINIIAAYAHGRVIGYQNSLPWHLPEDLQHFKATTLGHSVIMGRKTWESLGRPLPGRENVVITRNTEYQTMGAHTAPSLAAALNRSFNKAPFIIGGAEIYQQALALASHLYLTEIDLDVKGDAWFPEWSPEDWKETSRDSRISATGIRFDLVILERCLPIV